MLKSDTIDHYMRGEKLDPSNRIEWEQARKQLHARVRSKWEQQQRNRLADDVRTVTEVQVAKEQYGYGKTITPRRDLKSHSGLETDLLEDFEEGLGNEKVPPELVSSPQDFTLPRLPAVGLSKEKEDEHDKGKEDALIVAHMDDVACEPMSVLDWSGDEFVSYFAAINVVRSTKYCFDHATPEELSKWASVGNSRLAPVNFMFHCGIGEYCYQTHCDRWLHRHQLTCQGDNAMIARSEAIERGHPCPRPECGRSYSMVDILHQHIDRVHKTLQNAKRKRQANEEEEEEHAPIKKMKHKVRICPVQACKTSSKLSEPADRRRHLELRHGWDQAQIAQVIPNNAKPTDPVTSDSEDKEVDFKTWTCPVSRCTSTGKFTRPNQQRKHLSKVHGWTKTQVEELIPKRASGSREP